MKHIWMIPFIVLTSMGFWSTNAHAAEPNANGLNHLISACRVGDYSACSAYNKRVFERYQQRKGPEKMRPASNRSFNPFYRDESITTDGNPSPTAEFVVIK